jgi:hypothetical protein
MLREFDAEFDVHITRLVMPLGWHALPVNDFDVPCIETLANVRRGNKSSHTVFHDVSFFKIDN